MPRTPKDPPDAGNAVAFAGTVPPDHGLGAIRQHLIDHPRDRHWAIVELVSMETSIKHPLADEDKHRPTIQFLSIEAITTPAEQDQLRAMRDTARGRRPGQGSLEEAGLGEAGAAG
jgi:hypothetical protein